MSSKKNSSTVPTGTKNQREAAAYIFDVLIGLRSVAGEADLMMLAYLLEMAGSEASRIAEGGDAEDIPGP